MSADLYTSLLDAFPVQLEHSPSKGRYLIASRDLQVGEEVFCGWAPVYSIFEGFQKRVCACCLSWGPTGPHPIACKVCNWAHYCSTDCQELHLPLHQMLCIAHKKVTKADDKFGPGVSAMLRTLLEIAHLCTAAKLPDRAQLKIRQAMSAVQAIQQQRLSAMVTSVQAAYQERDTAAALEKERAIHDLILKNTGVQLPMPEVRRETTASPVAPAGPLQSPLAHLKPSTLSMNGAASDVSPPQSHPQSKQAISAEGEIDEREEAASTLKDSNPGPESAVSARDGKPHDSPVGFRLQLPSALFQLTPTPSPDIPEMSMLAQSFLLLFHTQLPKDREKEWLKPLEYLQATLELLDYSALGVPADGLGPKLQLPLNEWVQYMSRVECNAFGIYNGVDPTQEDGLMVGRSMCPGASFFNHSCEPNCQRVVFFPNLVCIRTVTPVSEGAELSISYIDHNIPRSSRRSQLLDLYCFKCDCQLCTRQEDEPKVSYHKKTGTRQKAPTKYSKKKK